VQDLPLRMHERKIGSGKCVDENGVGHGSIPSFFTKSKYPIDS
jgi:hypothetical protein